MAKKDTVQPENKCECLALKEDIEVIKDLLMRFDQRFHYSLDMSEMTTNFHSNILGLMDATFKLAELQQEYIEKAESLIVNPVLCATETVKFITAENTEWTKKSIEKMDALTVEMRAQFIDARNRFN